MANLKKAAKKTATKLHKEFDAITELLQGIEECFDSDDAETLEDYVSDLPDVKHLKGLFEQLTSFIEMRPWEKSN